MCPDCRNHSFDWDGSDLGAGHAVLREVVDLSVLGVLGFDGVAVLRPMQSPFAQSARMGGGRGWSSEIGRLEVSEEIRGRWRGSGCHQRSALRLGRTESV